jgi:hypothetical protein
MSDKCLIVLQENSGHVPLDVTLPAPLRQVVSGLIDKLAERFEDLKTSLQASGKYQVVRLLTDNACSRANLLDALVEETKKGRTIDLMVLGHGSPERLQLHVEPHLTGRANGNIRSLLAEARDRQLGAFNLRLVYMCNCYGSTLNDDWLAVGAKVSIGSRQLDMMPEPMITFFVHNWIAGQTAADAAKHAYEATIPFYLVPYPPTLQPAFEKHEFSFPCPTFTEPFKMCKHTADVPVGFNAVPHTYVKQTELVVAGNGDIRF